MTSSQLQAIDRYVESAMANTLDQQHNYQHVNRVRQNALKIVSILKIKTEIDLNLLQSACLLHDILYIKHRPGFITYFKESKYLRKMLPSILELFRLSETDRYILSEAVYTHTFAFPFRLLNHKYSLYSQIVQDADFFEMISDSRLIDFKVNKKFSKFYKIVSIFSGLFIKRIKKNTNKYINLPEIVEYFKEDYD